MLVTGPNGAGKTNLLESLHVGTQGFSPRTRADAQLIRTGADAARVALTGERDGRPLALEVTLQQAGQAGEAERRSASRGRAAPLGGRDARLHARSAGGREGRPGGAARVLRPLARPPAAGPLAAAGRVRGRGRAAKRRSAPSRGRGLDARRRRAVDRAGGDARAKRSWRSRREAIALLEPAFAAARRRARPARGARSTTTPSRPTVADLEARLERDLERGTTGLGPHLDDVTIRLGRPRPALLRLAGRAAARGAGAAPVRGGGAGRAPRRRRRSCSSTTFSRSSTRRAGARSAARIAGIGQTIVTATGADALPLEPAQLLEVTPGAVAVALMDRLDEQVRRELTRFGPEATATWQAIVRAWPAAVGETVARNAWPARLARDGTLHVNAVSATWAFELGRMAADDPRAASRRARRRRRRRRSKSLPDRSPSRRRSRRGRRRLRGPRDRVAKTVPRRRRSPRRSRTRSCASWSREPPRRASRKPVQARSDRGF